MARAFPLGGVFSYGVDILFDTFTKPLFKRGAGGSEVSLRGDTFEVPEWMNAFEVSKRDDLFSSGVDLQREIAEYQIGYGAEAGAAVPTYGEFALEESVKAKFDSYSKNFYYYATNSSLVDFVEMEIPSLDDFEPVLIDGLMDSARQCADSGDFERFFRIYGTHFVRRAAFGGSMKVEFDVQVDQIGFVAGIDEQIKASAAAEYDDIKGKAKVGFSDHARVGKDWYKKHVRWSYHLRGGNVGAKNLEEWLLSLNDASLPFEAVHATAVTAQGQSLSVRRLETLPISILLASDPDLQRKYEEQITAPGGYVGKHRLNSSRGKFKPAQFPVAHTAIKPGQKHSFPNSNKLNNTKVYVGLEGYPGTVGTASCTCGRWGDSQQLTAGELSDKFSGSYITYFDDITIKLDTDDPTQVLWAAVTYE